MKRQTPQKLSPEERIKSFAEVEKTLTPAQALIEASRCLFCHDAPCNKDCPSGVDVVNFIRKIKTKNFTGAIRLIREANPFGATCARVCPRSELCEKGCSSSTISEPIAIGDLQRYLMDIEFKQGIKPRLKTERKNKKVAVVGAGPSGLACANELAVNGFDVIVFEAMEKPGGVLRYGIPAYRLPKDTVDMEIDAIVKNGVEIRTGAVAGSNIKAQELLSNYDAVYIAAGLAVPVRMNIPGENLRGVLVSGEFLAAVNSGLKTGGVEFVSGAESASIFGGGNTAMDCACCAKRLGAKKVTIIYRRSEAEMPAWKEDYDFAKVEGVEFLWLTLPVKISEGNIECIKMKLGAPDSSGRPRPESIPGSEFNFKADAVIEAIGQKPDARLAELFSLAVTEIRHKNGCIEINHETLQTSIPKIFAGGDYTNGGQTVAKAVQEGKRAAQSITEFLAS